jgi:cytidylate kinase
MAATLPPVIAIDGPSASGKGTIAHHVAEALHFHHLDSGALYRIVAYVAGTQYSSQSESTLSNIALNLNVIFNAGRIIVAGRDVTDAIRAEPISVAASKVAAFPLVRAALLERQRAFRSPPGLVAEGRDMGSVVFPDAGLKIFLTASAEVRAERRYKQLMEKGLGASMVTLLQEIRERDARDSARAVAPLQKCADALELDTTNLTINEAAARVLAHYRQRAAKAP